MCSSSSPSKWLACHNCLCWTLFQCMSLHRDTRRKILYWIAYRVSIQCMNIFQWLSTDLCISKTVWDSDILLCDTSLPSDASSGGHYMPLELVALEYSLSYIPVGSGAFPADLLLTYFKQFCGNGETTHSKNWRACPTTTALYGCV